MCVCVCYIKTLCWQKCGNKKIIGKPCTNIFDVVVFFREKSKKIGLEWIIYDLSFIIHPKCMD